MCILHHFGKNEAERIYISRASKDENKEIFDFFHSKKDEIELVFKDKFVGGVLMTRKHAELNIQNILKVTMKKIGT